MTSWRHVAISLSLCVGVTGLVTPHVWASAEGDQAAAAGDWARAIELYTAELAEHPDDVDLHFNLGLAYAHTDVLAQATYHLYQAHYLDPGDRQIDDSLSIVKAEAQSREATGSDADRLTTGEPRAMFWLEMFHRLPQNLVELGIVAAAWLGFGLLLWRRQMEPSPWRDAALVLGLLSVLAWMGGIAYWVGAELTGEGIRPAVVVANAPLLREGPDRQAARSANPDLFAGAVVLIKSGREEWVEVLLANEEHGWLPRDAVRTILVPRP